MTARSARPVPTIIAIMTASMLLHGCANSPKTQYVTLNVTPGDALPVVQPMDPVQPALHIPQALDRPEVVTQAAPNRFEISETERWAAPLAQLMRLTLARDLETRLPGGGLVFPESPVPDGTRALVVTVIDIGMPADGELTLQAEWALVSRSPVRTEFAQRATLRSPLTGAGAEAKAAALSRALGKLADEIASSVNGR
ncbi:PqiC family protein [Caballeronia cordobensis]|uniref:PqiC family protein n=1 Tax=Caballeronia cordobensis TaxID=1353886 RepID=UPI0006AD6408|nr:PqiC family protein [Caballeronia cordobensis]